LHEKGDICFDFYFINNQKYCKINGEVKKYLLDGEVEFGCSPGNLLLLLALFELIQKTVILPFLGGREFGSMTLSKKSMPVHSNLNKL